jgi:hypothetical protein
LPFFSASYKRRVDIAQGISLTGFVASISVGLADINAGNTIDVYLFEDLPFDLNTIAGGIVGLPVDPFLIFLYRKGFAGRAEHIREVFDSPLKLRNNHTYTLAVTGSIVASPLTVPGNLWLTPFGYESREEDKETFFSHQRQ